MTSQLPAMRRVPYEQVTAALHRLQAVGALSADQVSVVLRELDRAPGDAPDAVPDALPAVQPPTGGRAAGRASGARLGWLAEAAAYAGAALVLIAAAVLVGQQWDQLGRPGRVTVLSAVAVVLAVAGARGATVGTRGVRALRRPGHAARRRLASTLLTGAVAAAAGTAAVLVPSSPALAAGIAAVLTVIAAQIVASSAVTETAALGSVCLLAAAVLAEIGAATVPTVLTFAAVGAGWLLLACAGAFTVPTPATVLGLTVLTGAGATGAFSDAPARTVGLALLAAQAAGCLAAFIRAGRWPAAAAAVAALVLLVLRVTGDSLGPVVAVLIAGLVLLGGGAALLLVRPGRAAPDGGAEPVSRPAAPPG
jgi:hypothetical protein